MVIHANHRPAFMPALLPLLLQYNHYQEGSKVGTPSTLEVDLVIGADGANSRVAKDIGAGEYDYAIAFQVCFVSRAGVEARCCSVGLRES